MALKVIRPRELVMAGKHNEPVYLKSDVDPLIAEYEERISGLMSEIKRLKDG